MYGTMISNRRALSDDVTNFSSIDYSGDHNSSGSSLRLSTFSGKSK
ncbi:MULTISPECIES: hypothetical protein [Rickettsieae]|nr:hypothetical protein [Rickettsia endosymbiont of Culicoides newsteadi]